MKSEGECSICELDVNAVFHRVNFNKYIEAALLIQQQSLIKELVSNLIGRESLPMPPQSICGNTSDDTIIYHEQVMEPTNLNCKIVMHRLKAEDYSILRQPICCIGPKLEDIFSDELDSLNSTPFLLVKPKIDRSTSKLQKPKVILAPQVQELIDVSYHHPKKEATISCKECPNKYSSEKSLYCHVRLVHRGLYNFECEKCGKKFLNKHHFGTHLRLHMHVLGFTCNVCGCKFPRKPLLTHHLLTEHGPKYECNHCGSNYRSSKSLRAHLREVGQKYECPKCAKHFSTYSSCN